MTSTYPTTADTFVRPSTADGLILLKDLVDEDSLDDAFDAIEALEAMAGVTVGTAGTGSAITDVVGNTRTVKIVGTDVSITVGNTTGVSFGGTKVFDFPAGYIAIHGAVLTTGVSLDLTDAGNVTPIAGTHGGDFAFGTTVAGDGTLTGTDVDIIPSTSHDPLSGTVAANLAADVAAPFDGSSTAVAIFINYLIDDADVANGASDVILASFELWVTYTLLGDN
jgi:hypothetical protein